MTVAAARAVALLAILMVAALAFAGSGPLPGWVAVPPGVKLTVLLLAPAILLATFDHPQASRALAMLALVLAALMLVAGAVAAWRTGTAAAGSSIIDVLRPTLLTALGIAALAAALVRRNAAAIAPDASALLGIAAASLFFLVGVGHLYGAAALTADPFAASGRSSGLGAVLLLACALAALAIHGGGPVGAYVGDEPGALAKRRMLPAAVVTPIGAGFLLLYAMQGRGLSPALAVALTVFANIAVMLVLIDGAGNKVAELAQEKEDRLNAKAAAARRAVAKDALTGLANRRGWDAAVQAAQKRCVAEGLEAGVWMIDLDGLKRVNDTLGHAAGDALIQAAAAALKQVARRGDALARLGGDEFACLVLDCDEDTAHVVTGRFEKALAEHQVQASIGFALTIDGAVAAAVHTADQAMYERKRARKLRRA